MSGLMHVNPGDWCLIQSAGGYVSLKRAMRVTGQMIFPGNGTYGREDRRLIIYATPDATKAEALFRAIQDERQAMVRSQSAASQTYYARTRDLIKLARESD